MRRLNGVAFAVLTTALLLMPLAAQAESKAGSLKDFFGTWVGRSISVQGEGLSDRDFEVTIGPHLKDGFSLQWTTVIRYKHKDTKLVFHEVVFKPYRPRPGFYSSAVRKDSFGKWVAANPLSGAPYVWASLEGRTLKVTALYVHADGGYELQVFKRTLTGDGMESRFERVRDGVQLRLITGKLERVSQ